MEREAEILALYLALREAIDQRIAELKALRALCSPGKSGTARTVRQVGSVDDLTRATWKVSNVKRGLRQAVASGDAAAILAAQIKVDAALYALASLRSTVAVLPVENAPPESTAVCGSATLENEGGVGPVMPVCDDAPVTETSVTLAEDVLLGDVPAESLTPEARFAAAFQDGASVPPKAGKPKSASVSVPAAGKSVKPKAPKRQTEKVL